MELDNINITKDEINKIIWFLNPDETYDLLYFLKLYSEEGKSFRLEKELSENTSGVNMLFYEIADNNPFSRMMVECKK